MQFSIYYHSQEHGEYLRHVIMASGVGQVRHFQDLSGLGSENEADVVLVEYLDNPHLDHLIAQIMRKPQNPEIFLFVEEISPRIIWKALKLGARELFSRTIPLDDLQAAVTRGRLRNAKRVRPHLGTGDWSEHTGWGPGWGACCGL